jgi:purine-nucleoside phosphorylase
MPNERRKIVEEIEDVTSFLEKRLPEKPRVAIILGSGLGPFTNRIENPLIVPYDEIPHFKQTSVEGHSGRIVTGRVGGVPLVALQGRWHFYEGYPMSSIVLPTRAMCMLGVEQMILTNAAGGVNLDFHAGDLMLIEDHINLMGDNPLTGKEPAEFGPRFPDMSEAYSKAGNEIFLAEARGLGIQIQRGTYVGLRGPTYETPAEVRMLRTLGGDAVGMSTVPEAIAARHLGVRVNGISCITNMAAGIQSSRLDHSEVTETAKRVIHSFSALLERSIPRLVNH